jgi:hypothetical protein
MRTAAIRYGTSRKLTMKPERSLVLIAVLPICSAKADARSTVSSAVSRPMATSTGFLTGDGREEVQSQDAIGAPGGGREPGDRDRRGVRREDRLGGDRRVQVLERLRLDRRVLDDRLDHELGLGESVQVGRPLDAPEQRLALVGGQPLALDRARDRALDRRARVLQRRGLRLVEPDGHPGPRG